MKRLVSVFLLLSLLGCSMAFAAGEPEGTAQEVTLDVIARQPEYLNSERQIWDIYEEENPHVTINLFAVNEDQTAAYAARVAAGNPAHITNRLFEPLDTTTYTNYVNLLEIDYPYWDKVTYDATAMFEQETGITGYLPALPLVGSPIYYTFVYHADLVEQAGLEPDDIRTMADVDEFFADLKVWVDSQPDVDYVFDLGFQPQVVPRYLVMFLAFGMGYTIEDNVALYSGEIDWLDEEANPVAAGLAKIKEWTDAGYLPPEWWTRDWGQEFEPSFIAKNGVVCFHGPWIWAKTESANPDARLSGFPVPATPNGIVPARPPETRLGAAIYSAWEDDPIIDEVTKAFVWFNSPEIIKLRAESVGSPAAMDLSEVGGLNLTSTQFTEVVKPLEEGKFGDGLRWSADFWGYNSVMRYRVPGTPRVMWDSVHASYLADYLSGAMSLGEYLQIIEDRWQAAYDLP